MNMKIPKIGEHTGALVGMIFAMTCGFILMVASIEMINRYDTTNEPILVYRCTQFVSDSDDEFWFGHATVFDANRNPIYGIVIQALLSLDNITFIEYGNAIKTWRTDENGTVPNVKWAVEDDSEQALLLYPTFFDDYVGYMWTNVSVPSLGLWELEITQIAYDWPW